jgi:hypothetical protein
MKRIIEVDLTLGAWLIVALFVLMHSSGRVIGKPTDIVLGVMLLVGAVSMLAEPPGHVALAIYEAVCGVCAIVTAGLLQGEIAPDLAANSVIVGTIVLVASLADAWILLHHPRRAD